MEYAPWMPAKKLPPVYGGRQLPSSLKNISFRGKVTVTWQNHTVPILWSLDRRLAGLKPLTEDELKERMDRLVQ
ncbi:unnamed protein product [Darwinula stevensoni]|uniref:Uncharacterized protein n=1 Tax=Darwinula stevensoni TaxID=69355 RepID=A0A7R9AEZ7_9CRUS|nr:unnamed protein product [Darwinula stevensoni]CAG0902820.1 unnamed protein product [Darwinula stevensoni]